LKPFRRNWGDATLIIMAAERRNPNNSPQPQKETHAEEVNAALLRFLDEGVAQAGCKIA